MENIPNSEARAALDAELFYDILVGELSTSQGDPGTGYALMLEAARRSGDAQLYRRATDIALQSRSGEYALAAARAWKEAQPQSREANRYVLQILIALNRIHETGDLLRQELAQSPPKDRLLSLQAIPQLYGRASDKAAAAAIVEKALADQLQNPATGPLAWTALGRMRLAAGDRKGALEAARNALAQEPTLDAAALLSLQLVEAGEADAEPLVARYMGGKPQPEIRMAYAGVLLNLQRYSEAGTQLDLLTREAPDMAEAWLLKATLALQSDRLQESESALEQFERLLQSYPPTDPRKAAMGQAYLLRSQIAEKRGDLAQAEAWLGKNREFIRTPGRSDAARFAAGAAGQTERRHRADPPPAGPKPGGRTPEARGRGATAARRQAVPAGVRGAGQGRGDGAGRLRPGIRPGHAGREGRRPGRHGAAAAPDHRKAPRLPPRLQRARLFAGRAWHPPSRKPGN